MARAAPKLYLERLRFEPLRGAPLIFAILTVWLTGALYCSGYEALSSGVDNWPRSLEWSAAAVLPWLTLFEFSKTDRGRQATSTALQLAATLAAVAALSLLAEVAINAASGERTAVGLALLRRLPAIGVCLLLVLWSRAGAQTRQNDALAERSLAELAPFIDWVGAADNYVELHVGTRTVMRRMTLRDAERALASHGFLRIHRRYLVKASRIAGVIGSSVERSVRLTDGSELPVGRSYAPNLSQAG